MTWADFVSCERLNIGVSSSTRISSELDSPPPLCPHERDSLQCIRRRYCRGKRKAECLVAKVQSWFRTASDWETWSNKVCAFFSFLPLLQFFSPLVVSKILLECGSNGRLNGEADVFFTCHQDAVAAMSRDRKHIGRSQKLVAPQALHGNNTTDAICASWNVQETATSSSSSTRPILTRGEEKRDQTAAEMFAHVIINNIKCSLLIQVIVDTLMLSTRTRRDNVFISFSAWRRHQPINIPDVRQKK